MSACQPNLDKQSFPDDQPHIAMHVEDFPHLATDWEATAPFVWGACTGRVFAASLDEASAIWTIAQARRSSSCKHERLYHCPAASSVPSSMMCLLLHLKHHSSPGYHQCWVPLPRHRPNSRRCFAGQTGALGPWLFDSTLGPCHSLEGRCRGLFTFFCCYLQIPQCHIVKQTHLS